MTKKIVLDVTDVRILRALQHHGQLSKSNLAEAVNLSPTPCWARLNKLKQAGLIKGYHADIALEKLCDFSLVIVTISLTSHRMSDFARFEDYICKLDEVVDCVATGGGMDYVMKVISPNLASFLKTMERLLAADLQIDRYMTYISTRQVKSSLPNIVQLTSSSDNDS